jgi:hypothetical protein
MMLAIIGFPAMRHATVEMTAKILFTLAAADDVLALPCGHFRAFRTGNGLV